MATGAPAHLGNTLYRPEFEHDACGVAFVVDIKGRRSHAIVEKGLTALMNLEHRGASGADPDTGDGAGILIQIPDAFLREVAAFELPRPGRYASGLAFFDRGGDTPAIKSAIATIAEQESV